MSHDDLLRTAPNHDGSRRDRADRFFGRIDPRIGTLLSASTSVGRHGERDDLMLRGLFGVALGVGAQFLLLGPGSRWADASLWSWALAIVVGFVGFWLMGANPRCSYVGDRGAQLVERRLRVLPRARVVRYDDAWDVKIAYTRVFRRGYQGTNAKFTWMDDEGRTVAELDGGFHEYRIDREEIDLDAIERLEPSHPVIALLAAVRAFHAFVDAENEASPEEA